MFDTLAIARALTAADFTPAQAEALTDAVRQAAEHDAAGVDVGTLATKADLAALKGAVNFATKADLAALEPRLVKWIVGTGVAVAGRWSRRCACSDSPRPEDRRCSAA